LDPLSFIILILKVGGYYFLNKIIFLRNGLSINGQKITKENENFEISLNITNWTLLLPQRNNLVENLQNNVFIQYMPELEEEGHFPEDRIAAMLDNDNQIFNLAKIDLDTELLSDKRKETKVRIELLNWILRVSYFNLLDI